MYPTIVIVLVETRRSMEDICELNLLPGLEARAATLGHPSLAIEPINSVVGDEAESPSSPALQSQDVQGRGLENVILEVNIHESQVSTIG